MADCQVIDRNNNSDFICGAVEGFYGRPWTFDQRKDLFRRLKNLNLNTFLYAPKDDTKHRAKWRQLYSDEEAEQLRILIEEAKLQGIDFYYSLAPGLDIIYSDQEELDCLIRKFDQIVGLGCECFAILFDDIEPKMNDKDSEIFKDYASAQVSTANMIFEHLNKPKFLFCPTEYCGSRAIPNVSDSPYLNTLGVGLNEAIDIMWSGPRVVPRLIPIESIETLTKVIRRPPVIWENLHANDYDKRRLFLGPYSGRSTKIIPKLKGVLSNPNCEYEANHIALHTLAQWVRSSQDINENNLCDPNQLIDESICISEHSVDDSIYDPNRALALAIKDWLPCLKEFKSHSSDQIRPPLDDHQALAAAIGIESRVKNAHEKCDENEQSQPLDVTTNIDMVAAEDEDEEIEEIWSKFSYSSGDKSNKSGEMELSQEPIDENCDSCEMPDVSTVSSPAMNSESNNNNRSITNNNNNTNFIATNQKYSSSNQSDMIADNTQPVLDITDNNNIRKENQLITFDGILLLVDLFHLPFEHGSRGRKLLRDINWLKDNSELLCSENHPVQTRRKSSLASQKKKQSQDSSLSQGNFDAEDAYSGSSDSQDSDIKSVDSWNIRADKVNFLCNSIRKLLEVLIYDCPNRVIVSELLPYLVDLVELMSTVVDYIKYLRCRNSKMDPFDTNGDNAELKNTKDQINTNDGDEQEPWVHRGGLIGDIRKLMY